MKISFAFTLITALALCVSQVSGAEKKNVEANKLAREGAEAAKNQDWDKAVELLRKATAMDHKYADELAAVYQRRGYADASEQSYQAANVSVTPPPSTPKPKASPQGKKRP